jgi:uncharacterized membrane protein HdeD (DUF308 family)
MAATTPNPALRDGNDGMSAVLAQNWWALALRGVCAILFGVIALLVPGAELITLALFFAAYLLVDGILAIVAAVRAAQRHERWGMLLAEGVVDIAVGVIAFVFMTAAWALLTGMLLIVAAFKLNRQHGRAWMALSGIISVLFGIALIVAPLVGAVVLTWWFAGYAIAFGALLLVLAFKLRSRNDTAAPTGAMPHGA